MGNMEEFVIDIKNLNFSYDGDLVFSELDFKVEKAKIYAVTGESGLGKTTLLKIINGYFTSEEVELSGYINVLGDEIPDLTKIASMYQDVSLQIIFDNVFRELAFGLENQNADCDKVEEKVRAIASRLEIDNLLSQDTNRLSYGEKQLVVVAATLLLERDLYILDEPFSALAKDKKNLLISELKAKREHGKTIVVALHEVQNMDFFDKVYKIRDGKLIEY